MRFLCLCLLFLMSCKWFILGDTNKIIQENKMHYHLVNSAEKDRIKNNDKSIAALKGKSMLYDSPAANNKYLGKMWKYQKNNTDYKQKLMQKEKFAKLLGMKKAAKPDKSLGETGNTKLGYLI